MDFAAWSPSHTLILVVTLLAFFGQLVAILTYLKVTVTRHSKGIRRLSVQIGDMTDELRVAIREVRNELRVEIRDVRLELSKLNQNHIDHLNRHDG